MNVNISSFSCLIAFFTDSNNFNMLTGTVHVLQVLLASYLILQLQSALPWSDRRKLYL